MEVALLDSLASKLVKLTSIGTSGCEGDTSWY